MTSRAPSWSGQAKRYRVGRRGGPINVLATAEKTGGALGVFENSEAPGQATTLHVHRASEAFYILDGAFEFYIDGEWVDASAGSLVFIPGGVPHGFRAGPSGGQKVVVFVPGGSEGFFVEWREVHDAGDETSDAIASLAERYGLVRLGALPERSE